jgi:hypothetical protein
MQNYFVLRTRIFDEVYFNVQNIKRVSYLVYVIQFTLKELFDKLKINSKNEDFQTNWNDKQNKKTMKRKEKHVSYTLTKINIIFVAFFEINLIKTWF